MNNNPIISVIIPVYNVEKYLSQCLDSILGQTFTDFELLLVDDGTPDNSGLICDEYAEKDYRIRVFHQKNLGASASRNIGIDNAKGEYIVFVDSDDYVEEDYLSHLYQSRPNEDLGMGIVVQGCKRCDEKGMVIKTTHLQPCLYLYTKIDTFFAQEIDSWGIFSPCAKLFQRKFLNEHSIRFDSKTRFAEDIPFILQCISECNYIVIGSELDYYYINHSGTVSNSLYSFDSLYYSFSLCEQGIFKVIEKCKFSVQGSHNLFKTINFIFSTLLKSDYHYLKEVTRKNRISNLCLIKDNNIRYLRSYYSPDYMVDKLGRILLMKGWVQLYDMLLVVLFRLKFKKMYAPPSI
jgi:glycosyltransferase involved in cell wall biosynthesis